MRDLDREAALENEQEDCFLYDNYAPCVSNVYLDIENGRKAFKYWMFEEVDLAGLHFTALSYLQG